MTEEFVSVYRMHPLMPDEFVFRSVADHPQLVQKTLPGVFGRERGVPRYNEFRKLLHMNPVESFEELTEDAGWREELRKVYDNNINRVDLMVGMYAEKLPPGFGFSDTAFRIFVLMASRRLKSNRFLSEDFRPEIYTQTGIDWVENNNMSTVLLRHFPKLEPSMGYLENTFEPWKAIGG